MKIETGYPGELTYLARLISYRLRVRWRKVRVVERIGWSLGAVFAVVTATILIVDATDPPLAVSETIGRRTARWSTLRWTLAGCVFVLFSIFYSNAIQAIIQSRSIRWLLLSSLSAKTKVGYLLFEIVSRGPFGCGVVILTFGSVVCCVMDGGWIGILGFTMGLPLFGWALLAACFLSCLTLRTAARLRINLQRTLPLLQLVTAASVSGLSLVALHKMPSNLADTGALLWVFLPSTSLADGLLSLKYGDHLVALGHLSSCLAMTLVSAALCYHGSSKLWPDVVSYPQQTAPFSQSFRALASRIRPAANRPMGWLGKDLLELLRDPHYRYALLVFPLVCLMQVLVQRYDLYVGPPTDIGTPPRHMMMWSLTGTYLIPLLFTGHAVYLELRLADLFRTILPGWWLGYKVLSQTSINGVFVLCAAVPFFAFLEPGFRGLEVGFFVVAALYAVPVMTMFVLGLAVLCADTPGILIRLGISSAGILLYLASSIAAYAFGLALYEDLASGRPPKYEAATAYFFLFTIVAVSFLVRAMEKTQRRG